MEDHSLGARAMRDVDPSGPMAHDLPHKYLPLRGYDRRHLDGVFQPDDGQRCQFTAGGQRCQGTREEHEARWPERRFDALTWAKRLTLKLDEQIDRAEAADPDDSDPDVEATGSLTQFFDEIELPDDRLPMLRALRRLVNPD